LNQKERENLHPKNKTIAEKESEEKEEKEEGERGVFLSFLFFS